MLLCCHIEYDAALLERALRLSLPERRQRARAIRSERARAASLAAGLLLRYGLGRYGVFDADIAYTKAGKPYLLNSPLHLSLSHSGDYAACAISERSVGVDIQKIVQVSERAVSRFCTAEERRYLDGSRDVERDIIRLWALKESWLKAAGSAAADMFKVSFKLCGDGAAKGPEGFACRLYEQLPGYILAVCESEQAASKA